VDFQFQYGFKVLKELGSTQMKLKINCERGFLKAAGAILGHLISDLCEVIGTPIYMFFQNRYFITRNLIVFSIYSLLVLFLYDFNK